MHGRRTRAGRLQSAAIALLMVWSWLLVAHQAEHHLSAAREEALAGQPRDGLPAARATHSAHEPCLLCLVQQLPRQGASGPALPHLSAPACAVASRVDQAPCPDGRTATARAPPLLPI